VLALLREGLSNEEIAARLGISLAGAKYHVSEILGKLGVASREEAARWTPERRPWWATAALAPVGALVRRAGSSWLTTGAAAGAFVIVAAGLGLLVWGLLRTSGGGKGATVSCVPQEIVNYLVNVETVDGASFSGPAGSTIFTPEGEVTVRVDETTEWYGDPVASIEDVRAGMRMQAVGPLTADCAIDAVTVLAAGDAGPPFFTTLGAGLYNGADWSPDGRSVAFALDGVLYRADGPRFPRYVREPLIAEPLEFPARTPKWSPDGGRIAFVSRHQGRFDDDSLDSLTIYMVNADGTGVQDLLPGTAADLAPTDSKGLQGWLDNDTVLFDQGCGTACQQPYLLHVETGEVEPVVRVTNATTGAESGILGTVYHYSPDQRWIAVENLGRNSSLVLYDREERALLDLAAPTPSAPDTGGLIGPWQQFDSWAADSGTFLYELSGVRSDASPVPPYSLHLYDLSTREDRVLAEVGRHGAFSADGSRVAYVTEATEEQPCGDDARVACIAVMDLASGEELYRFTGPTSAILEGSNIAGFLTPTFVPDGRVLYVTAAGDLAIADGERTGLLLGAQNVVDVLPAPDGSAAVVAEAGQLTLVPIPARGGTSLPAPAPLSPPDGGPIAPTPTPEQSVAFHIDCPGGFATPEEAIEACYDIGPNDIFVGDCDTPDPSPPAESIFDRPCSIWEDGLTSPRSYVIGNSGVDGFDRVIVERRADGWIVTARGGCSIQRQLDSDLLLGDRGDDVSVVRVDDCRMPPAPLPRPTVRVGTYVADETENGRTRFSLGAGLFYAERGVKLAVSITNVSGDTLAWASDAGGTIELVSEDGIAYRATEVGGTLARSVPEGFPPNETWSGWFVFRIDELGTHTLRYPGQSDIVLELTPEHYNSSRRDYFERLKD